MKFLERMKQFDMSIVSPGSFDMKKELQGERAEGRVKFNGGGTMKESSLRLAELVLDVMEGRKNRFHLHEAMTTSDFPLLFGDVLYRQLLGIYKAWPKTYPAWTRAIKVKDLRTFHMYTIDGGQGLLDKVGEREPYPETKFTEGQYTIAVSKYGRRFGISKEMVLNDDLSAFQERPRLMITGSVRSREYLATTMLCSATGPNTTMYTSGHANIVTGNPILSTQGLQTAMAVLAAMKDADGNPIRVMSWALVVPPALEITAMNILNATQIRVNASAGSPPGGGTAENFLYVNNWMKGKVQVIVNPYIPIIATTNGSTSWFLVANPEDATERPAYFFADLIGYEDPQLFMKSSNAIHLGGGPVDAFDGDFDSDAMDFKLRDFFGAAQGDYHMTVASNGSGS